MGILVRKMQNSYVACDDRDTVTCLLLVFSSTFIIIHPLTFFYLCVNWTLYKPCMRIFTESCAASILVKIGKRYANI